MSRNYGDEINEFMRKLQQDQLWMLAKQEMAKEILDGKFTDTSPDWATERVELDDDGKPIEHVVSGSVVPDTLKEMVEG